MHLCEFYERKKPKLFLNEIDKQLLKFRWKWKEPRIVKAIFLKEKKVEGHKVLDVKT